MKGDDRQLRIATITTKLYCLGFAKPAIENDRERIYNRGTTKLN